MTFARLKRERDPQWWKRLDQGKLRSIRQELDGREGERRFSAFYGARTLGEADFCDTDKPNISREKETNDD